MRRKVFRIVSRCLKQSMEMNLLKNYDDTLLAMAELEGEGWLNDQLTALETDQLTVPHAIKLVKKHHKEIEEVRQDLEKETDPEEIESLQQYLKSLEQEKRVIGDAIYGSGGWHRYFMYSDGEVVFSGMHAVEDMRSKAKELGFEIF